MLFLMLFSKSLSEPMEFNKSLLKDSIDRSQGMPPAQQPQPKPEKLNSSFVVGGETPRYWEKAGSILFPFNLLLEKKPIETQVFLSCRTCCTHVSAQRFAKTFRRLCQNVQKLQCNLKDSKSPQVKT